MNSNQETFIFKEFIVGLIVIVVFLLLFLLTLQKVTKSDFYKNIFNKKEKVVKTDPDYCQNYDFFKNLSKDNTYEFTRTIKRVGWQDKTYKFNLAYQDIQKNKITYQISSENNEVPSETLEVNCSKEGISLPELDKTVVASFLNTYPEKLDEFAKYKPNKEGLKGSLGEAAKYCFTLTANSDSNMENFKIEKNWEGTPSAYLKETKNANECENYNGEYDTKAFVEFKEELWFATPSGIVKRKITPNNISGQVTFLPNGYQQLEITDEVLNK